MRSLYFIRHGETDFNRRNIVQGGGIDADLNEEGRTQGRKFFENYHHLDFNLVVCTGLKRTFQTVEPFVAKGHEIVVMPELNELSWGIIEGEEATPHVRGLFEEINQKWKSGDLHAAVEGGESPVIAWERCAKGIDKLLEVLPENGNALVCIHGRISRIILSEMLGYGMQHMNHFPHHNTALNLLRERPGKRWVIERMNDISHLA